ncbi:hypothetical protein NL676_011064 [Syzygium grande]|nr:hypothetical protein NL676_011064 [Syzygium grande]
MRRPIALAPVRNRKPIGLFSCAPPLSSPETDSVRDDGLEAVNPVELQSETREALLLLRLLLPPCNVLALASRPRDIGRPSAAPKRRGIADAAGDGAGRRGEYGPSPSCRRARRRGNRRN